MIVVWKCRDTPRGSRTRSYFFIFPFIDPASAMDVLSLNPASVLSSAFIKLEWERGEGVPNVSFAMLHALDPDLPAWFTKSFWYFSQNSVDLQHPRTQDISMYVLNNDEVIISIFISR